MSVETIAVISDVHFPNVHLPTWRAFRAWHLVTQPARTIVLGDFFDLPQVSSHAPEVEAGIEILPPIKGGCHQLRELSEECGRLDFVEGNHSERLYKKLILPLAYQMRGLENLFSLEAICRAHGLPASVVWHSEKPPAPVITVGQFVLRHGHKQAGRFGGGVTPARTLLLKEAHQNWSALVGHHHRPQTFTQGDRVYAVNPHMEADVKYTGGIDGWCRGWSVLELDTETNRAQLKQYLSNDGRFIVDGRVFDGKAEGASVGAARAQPEPAAEQKLDPAFVEARDHFFDTFPKAVKALAEDEAQGFSARSWYTGNRRNMRFKLPNAHGRWVDHDTAAAGRWAGLRTPNPANLVHTRVKRWEAATGLPVEQMTWAEFQEQVCSEVASMGARSA